MHAKPQRSKRKVNELTQLVRAREQALDEKEVESAKGQELLQHDRDIRELMVARELYMADVHDVSGKGTDKTYGRVFYTKGKRLIFYAFDLDAQPGIQNRKYVSGLGSERTGQATSSQSRHFLRRQRQQETRVLKATIQESGRH